jgi:branched-chain amino acid transport system permease protein
VTTSDVEHREAKRVPPALVVRGWRLLLADRRPAWAVGFIVVSILVLTGGQTIVFQATLITIYAIVALSQEWLFGRAGQISLGAAALMAIGAYTTALTSVRSGFPFPLPTVLSVLAGALVGLIISVPGLRFRGLYLMLTTLALQFIVSFLGKDIEGTSHESGFTVHSPGWLTNPTWFLLLCLVLVAVVMLLLDGMYRSAPGRAWSAIRQNEVAAAVMGVSTVRWKILAFVGSSAICALGGSLYAYNIGNVDYNSFSLDLGLTIVVIVFVGGVGRLFGAIVGAVFIGYLPVILDDISGWFPAGSSASAWLQTNEPLVASATYGFLLLIVLLFERGGIAELLARLIGFGRRRIRWKRAVS